MLAERTTRTKRINAFLRITAAIVGAGVAAVALSVLLSLMVPLSADARFAVGFFLMPFLWVATMCLGFLFRSGGRAWGLMVGTTALAWVGIWLLSRA